MFMAILDIQIVSSSLSEIQAGLSASADEISWVQTAYLIAEVVMIPLSGFLSRVLSTRVLFVISAAGFTLMSAGCALAWSIGSMVLFRAAQGFIGGAMIPTVFATSFTVFSPASRAGVTVVTGLVATMAPTLGPTLGGYLTQAFSWHWLFLINIVPGSIVVIVVWLVMDIDEPNHKLLKGFDFAGIVLMALFLGCLEYALEEGPRNDWLEDDTILAATIVSGISAVLFVWRVLTHHNPIVDLRTYRDRNFALGSLYSFIIGTGLYGAVYVLPLFLAQVRGYNSLQIGLTMMVTGACQFLSAPIAGFLSKKMDLRLMLALGFGLFGFGLYLNSGLTNQAGFWELALPQAVRGSSLMFCFLPVTSLALGTLPPERLKNASGLFNLMRNLGGAIGLAVINSVITWRLALHFDRLGERLNLANPWIQSYVDAIDNRMTNMIPGDSTMAAYKVVARLIQREATVLTFNDCLLLMAGVFAFGLVMMPLIRKPRPVGAGPGH
jgi:DHA2 family multidrug resistance protein